MSRTLRQATRRRSVGLPERELDIDHLMPDIARRSLRGVAVTFGAQAVKLAI